MDTVGTASRRRSTSSAPRSGGHWSIQPRSRTVEMARTRFRAPSRGALADERLAYAARLRRRSATTSATATTSRVWVVRRAGDSQCPFSSRADTAITAATRPAPSTTIPNRLWTGVQLTPRPSPLREFPSCARRGRSIRPPAGPMRQVCGEIERNRQRDKRYDTPPERLGTRMVPGHDDHDRDRADCPDHQLGEVERAPIVGEQSLHEIEYLPS